MSSKNKLITEARPERGFSLIEVLVAIAVMMLLIAAPLSLVYDAVKYERLSEDETIAVYLAQDVLEYVRAQRSYNKIHGNVWDDGISCSSARCIVDTTKQQSAFALTPCAGTCPMLKYDDTLNLYKHDTGATSKFQRYVEVISHATNKEVIATVEWTERGELHTTSLTMQLYEL